MIHMAETLYGCSLAASYEGKKEPSGTYFIDPVLANASKIHEGKEMAEIIRLLIDITGGFVADLPSDKDFNNPEIGDLLKKVSEGSHGSPGGEAGQDAPPGRKDGHGERGYDLRYSRRRLPAAHRLTIYRESDINHRKNIAKRLAGIEKS